MKYFEDWSAESVGGITAPLGWTKRWHTSQTLSIVSDANAPDGKALRWDQGATLDRCILTHDAASADGDSDEIEVALLVRVTSTTVPDGYSIGGPLVRASGTSSSETGYAGTHAGKTSTSSKYIAVSRYVSATFTNIGDNRTGIMAAGDYYWLRLKVHGTALTYRISTMGDPDTILYTISLTASSISGTGWCGIFGFSYDFDVLAVGIGTNGDDAPLDYLSDTTAPILTSPAGASTGQTTASGSVSSDEGNGTLYAVATTSGTAPSVAQIQAGQDNSGSAAAYATSQSVTATGTQNVSATGLTASTTYYWHFQQEDAAANDSTVVTSASFTTDASDVTAPILSSPSGTPTSDTTADGGVSTNEGNGTLYAVVTTSATPPSVAQVQAGQDHTGAAAVYDTSQAVSATGAQSVAATGLTADTSYYWHFQQQDAAANDSTVSTSASFTTYATIAIADDYERSSVKLADSSISGYGDSAIVTIRPRVQESEITSSETRWLEPSAKITGVDGVRPTFRFTGYNGGTPGVGLYHGNTWQSTRRPMFSYDRETWTYFDTQTVNTTYIEFRHNAAFTADTVYISRNRQISVEQCGAWLEGLATSYPSLIGPSDAAAAFTPTLTSWSGQAFIADEFSAQTNELGATIPATPFYAAQIEDTSLTPASGNKTIAVITGGVHAGEDHGEAAMREFVEFILGNDTDAQEIRRHYNILMYPMINAPGRAGGGWRGSFTNGPSGHDDANRHFRDISPEIEIVSIPRAVILSDMGSDNPDWTIDWHADYANGWGLFEDVGQPLHSTFRTTLATNSGFTVTDRGNTITGMVSDFFYSYGSVGAGFAVTLEHGASSPVSDADLATWGAAVAATLVDMQGDLWRGEAIDYGETYTVSAISQLALIDAWLLDFAETYGANASGDLALTDSWSLDYSEAYAVGAAADLALADVWSLDYAESLTVTATGDLALSNAYAVGNNYDESFSVAAVAELSLTDVWAPHYGETLASDATAALALTDTWQLDYAETLAASAAAELLLSDAYDSPAPGAYDETFSASAIAALDLTHLFTTPNALPPGINHLTARRVGGFFAVKP